jgi:hypothetical protein
MFKKFSTKELVFLALIGAIVFAFDLIIVSGIDAMIGVAGSGMMIDTIFVIAITIIGGLVVRKFGAYTLLSFIYTLLAVPTNIVGPPGLYKVAIGIIMGLFADIIILLFKYKPVGCYLCLPLANALAFPVLLYTMIAMNLPGTDALMKYVWVFLGISFVEGLIGAWLGMKLYERIKNRQIIKQIEV